MMRTFEERMAEISRRSEKIKKERKDMRNRLLLACIPLVVCVGLYGILLMGQGNSGNLMPVPESKPELDGATGSLDGTGFGYTQLHFAAGSPVTDEAEQLLTDQEQVKAVYTLLTERYRYGMSSESKVEDDGDSRSPTEDQESADISDVPLDNYAQVMEWRFTFRTSGGAEAIFTLTGNRLTDAATGESNILPPEQLSKLWELLGR